MTGSKTLGGLAALATTLGGIAMLTLLPGASATGADPAAGLPDAPPNGEMGFVVTYFTPPSIPGMEACPEGPALKLRDAYIAQLPAGERARLLEEENKAELERAWKLYAFGPGDTNICAQPDAFDRPAMRTVEASQAWGLDLDGGDTSAGCAHEEFTTPNGRPGIDNQEYRALGCKLEWRGQDGNGGEFLVGTSQFHKSGEWTQVILLRGVDSLRNDPDVEVIYANTPDVPLLDGEGNFLPGATFTISTAPPRERNVLRGQIVGGVLMTQPQDIKLTQTWGQGGARDIRGNRTKWDFREGRLQLRFEPDGSLKGFMGGYRPLFDLIASPSFGSAGSAIVAGIDCAQELQTIKRMADGLKNPATGQCEGISSAVEIRAIPAFINDAPPTRTARN